MKLHRITENHVKLHKMLEHYINVVYDIALGECGVRYCPSGMWCTILLWRNVVYDTALGSMVYGAALEELWCTILLPDDVCMCVRRFMFARRITYLLLFVCVCCIILLF